MRSSFRGAGGYRASVLHLRVIVPGDMRDDVLTVLRGQVGVAHILVHPGAALDPPGDEITALLKEGKLPDREDTGDVSVGPSLAVPVTPVSDGTEVESQPTVH